MHWRQREMLFEQTEALKEKTGTRGNKNKEYDGRLDKKNPNRKYGDDTPGQMSDPIKQGKAQKPNLNREESGASNQGGSKNTRRGIGRRRGAPGTGGGGFSNKSSGKESGRRPPKKKTESHCEAYAEAYVRGVEQALYETSPGPMPIIDANAVNSLNSVIAEYNALIAQGADPAFALASAGTPNGMVMIGGYSIPLTAFVDPLSPRGTIRFISLRQFIGSALSEIGIDLSGMRFVDPMALRPFRPGENFTGTRRPVSQFGPPAKPAPRQDPRMNVKAPPPMRPGPAG